MLLIDDDSSIIPLLAPPSIQEPECKVTPVSMGRMESMTEATSAGGYTFIRDYAS